MSFLLRDFAGGEWLPALERDKRPAIQTAVMPMESRALYELAQAAGSVLEVGAWFGYSTVLMARAGALVYSIDPHTELDDTWETFNANLEEFGVRERVTVDRDYSSKVLPRLERLGARFGAAFIDGDHSFETCSLDIRHARRLVRPGGVIACHDYTPLWPGVVQAVREEAPDLIAGARRVGSLILLELPAESPTPPPTAPKG